MLGCFHTHPAHGFGSCILKQFRIDVVFANVVVEDNFFIRRRFDHVRHRAQLNPSTGVQNHVQICVRQVSWLDVFIDAHDPLIGIDERQVWRDCLAAYDANLLAQRFQDASHPQATTKCIAVGANVAG